MKNKFLLDTHVFVWWFTSPERLTLAVAHLFQAQDTELYFSSASSWELAIKFQLGKIELPESPDRYVQTRMQIGNFIPLPIHHSHALRVGTLPLHHRDPFDRLLIAQAQMEGLTVLTADRQFESYDVGIMWVD